ncbi:hypothetical protein CROQUDRAFT_656167 [Cronartium quercuum f. sp. fusiforme G11]|uniref:Casein kinase substrate phosphoprotein PP28 domain-containing protein n=1 Tax=Cronartium quercuum f. sp. fusiforme G11 TaxID=708437 RepID=A0A9P6TD80_9BASI|nr:hypothetical protein CROQUDRAFT_656167 [Cronartium quercuum f. sp. fusiforme G11]
MVRNAGKFGKPKRGGGKMFSRDLQRLDDNEGRAEDSEDGSSAEETESSEGSDEEPGSNASNNGRANNLNYGSTLTSQSSSRTQPDESGSSMTTAEARAARKAAKKGGAGKAPKKDDSDDDESDGLEDLANPNRAQKKAVKISEIEKVASGPMNRKEREAAEKKAAQERYWKLHQAGKTDEAKVDLARLAKIRQEREHAAAVRKAEAEAKEKETAAKLAARKKR